MKVIRANLPTLGQILFNSPLCGNRATCE